MFSFLNYDHTGSTSSSVETGNLLPHIFLAVVSLNQAQVSSSVINTNCISANGEIGNHGPGVSEWVISLHACKPALLRITDSRSIMTTNCIEETIEHPHCHASPSLAHVGHTAPLIGMR